MIDRRASQIEDPVAKLRFLRDSQAKVEAVEGVLSHPKYWWLRNKKVWLGLAVLLAVPTVTLVRSTSSNVLIPASVAPSMKANSAPDLPLEKIWLVETKNKVELWSNGLHIDTRFQTPNRPRQYYAWNWREPNSTLTQLPIDKPVGIVFHTTESQLEDLDEKKNRRLIILGEQLMEYVKRHHAYHYVIDRFGRVFRIVQEQDAAFHAGRSIWADDKWAYVSLNESFLGVSFETQTTTGDEAPIISQAQIDSGRMLTKMLRSRYDIRSLNCATHAQVSINPGLFLIGYHTDWAGNFPFEDFGLPDNYSIPLPSLIHFGFNYDGTFFTSTGYRMWNGIVAAEDLLRAQAKQQSLSVAQLKSKLRNEYRRLSALLPERPAPTVHPKDARDPQPETAPAEAAPSANGKSGNSNEKSSPAPPRAPSELTLEEKP